MRQQLSWIALDFALLTSGAALNIISHKSTYSWPVTVVYEFVKSFCNARVSSGRMVVYALQEFAFDILVIRYNKFSILSEKSVKVSGVSVKVRNVEVSDFVFGGFVNNGKGFVFECVNNHGVRKDGD